MTPPLIQLSTLQPLARLRLRTRGAYTGTITAPGPLVSDGKLIFTADAVPEALRPLAEEVAALPGRTGRRIVPQQEAAALFEALARTQARKAQLLGQMEKPLWIHASDLDHVAVLRYGRGASAAYVLLDAHRLLLLDRLTAFDEILCEGPSRRVVLRRTGRPVAGLTALPVTPEVAP